MENGIRVKYVFGICLFLKNDSSREVIGIVGEIIE